MLHIIDPSTNKSISIYSQKGTNILKKYIKNLIGGMKKQTFLKEPTQFKILHFGCWNNNKCVFDEVLVNRFIQEQNINLFVVTGDNYYSESLKKDGKKYKEWNKSILENGFNQCLHKIKIPKKFILGNHDILDNNPLFVKNKDRIIYQKSLDCSIIEEQKKLIESNKDDFIFPNKVENIIVNSMTISLIYLSTDLYEMQKILNKNSSDPKTNRNIQCIIDLLNPIDNVKNKKNFLNYLVQEQNKLILNEFEKNPNFIVLFGHEPIISCKKKKR